MCAGCRAKLLSATDAALAAVTTIAHGGPAARTEYAQVYAFAMQAMRDLVRLVPAGQHTDLLIYARVCVVRNDLSEAEESVRKWREAMGAIGVLPR